MKKIYTIIIALVVSVGAFGQAGSLDKTFNSLDKGKGDGASTVTCSAVQPDGKIIIGGFFDRYNNTKANSIARLNMDGSVDTTFSSLSLKYASVRTIVIQPDGKILVGRESGYDSIRLVRLMTNGTIDTGFYCAPIKRAYDYLPAKQLKLQTDGKILCTYDHGAVFRYNIDGSRDTTFTPYSCEYYAYTQDYFELIIQPDGKILDIEVSGDRIVRRNSDGTIDTSFHFPSSLSTSNSMIKDFALQADGKIIVYGDFAYNVGNSCIKLLRLNANGSIDNTFKSYLTGGNYLCTYSACGNINLLPNGKIIVPYYKFKDGVYITKMNNDGTKDNSFTNLKVDYRDSNLPKLTPVFSNIDSSIIFIDEHDLCLSVGGKYFVGVFKVKNIGALDLAFNPGNGINYPKAVVNSIVSQKDNKIIAGGYFNGYNGKYVPRIVRINPNGSIDPSFNFQIPRENDYISQVNSVVIQPDSKIIIGGENVYTSNDKGTYTNHNIIRVNSNGSIDNTFNASFIYDVVYDIVVQPDGKILYSVAHSGFKRRLHSNGEIDTTFNIPYKLNGYISSPKILTNGKILALCSATYLKNNGLYLLNNNGSIDTTFKPIIIENVKTKFEIQSDGKLLIVVDSISKNGITRRGLVRMYIDGSIDTTFNANHIYNQNIKKYFLIGALKIQSDGKILISFSHDSIYKFFRLNIDGSIDTSFNNGAQGANNHVSQIEIQNDSKLIIGGSFTEYNGVKKNRLVRLNNDALNQTGNIIGNSFCEGDTVKIPFSKINSTVIDSNYVAQLSDTLGSFVNPTIIGSLISGKLKDTIIAIIPNGIAYSNKYRLRVFNTQSANIAADNGSNLSIGSYVTPTLSLVASDTLVCSGNNVTFSAKPKYEGTTPSYNWSLNGLTIVGAKGSTYTSSALLNKDTIQATLTSSAICVTKSLVKSNKIGIIVNNSNFGLAISANDSTLTSKPYKVNFNNNTLNANSFKFSWNFGDSTTFLGIVPPSHTYVKDGKFDVLLVALDTITGCSDTLQMKQFINCYDPLTVNIKGKLLDSGFLIYPNPTNSHLTISGLSQTNQTINITNIVGETVQTESTNDSSNIELNVSNLPSGLYFVSVGGKNVKFIKN